MKNFPGKKGKNGKLLMACLALIAVQTLFGQDAPSPKATYLHGYLIVPVQGTKKGFDQGFSLYVPVWPLENYYPGHNFETGLPGTWMFAKYKDPAPKNMYSDAEGGLGWWTNTHFPQLEPKFEMGGVGPNFSEIASGPNMGTGTWQNPKGIYGVAQLSPWLLFPPDEINMAKGQKGEFLGYGYMNLPLIPPKAQTDGKDVPTGGNCWTLFLNAKNFKGPVAFFLPYFWSHFGLQQPNLVGQLLDLRPMDPNMAIQMETHYIAAKISQDADGNQYARIAPTSFPANVAGGSILVAQSSLYSRDALWNTINSWFEGGKAAKSQFNQKGTFNRSFKGSGFSTWAIETPQADGKDQPVPIDFNAFAKAAEFSSQGYGYRWDPALTRTSHGLTSIPEYYRLSKDSKGQAIWEPVQESNVPSGTGLKEIVWVTPKEEAQKPFEMPLHSDKSWRKPGPKAGPFYAYLSDGTVVTYYWYRFEDQPALQHADLSQLDRDSLQARFEKLERHWTLDKEYMAPPMFGKLASIDPSLIVHPPKGLKIGYVPIAVGQKLVSKARPKSNQ